MISRDPDRVRALKSLQISMILRATSSPRALSNLVGFYRNLRVCTSFVVYSRQRRSVPHRKMMLFKNWRAHGHGWRTVLVAVAICSLALCLATRFAVPLTSQNHAVKSIDDRAGEPKRLNLTRDATQFAAPVATASCLEPTVLYMHAVPSGPMCTNSILSLVLYNRPPPSSSVFFL